MRLLVLSTLLAVAACRQKRSIGSFPSIGSGLASIGSIFSPSTPAPHAYPVYKVHKYTGIQLKPISHEELAALQPVQHVRHEHGYKEALGHPPQVIDIVPEYYSEPYSSEPYPAADRDTQAALAAIDNLGGIASLLPEGARGRSLDLEKSSEVTGDEAEDRIGLLRKKPLKLKKKGLLALLGLKGGPKAGLGLAGSSGLGFIGSSGLLSSYGSASPAEELPSEGPYPGHTTIYRAPPPTPTGGFLSGLSFRQEHNGIPLELPEPSFPEIPELKVVPEAPKLPHFTLPGNYKLPYSTGTYLSIKVPKPHVPTYTAAPEYIAPHQEYGPPSHSYGPPSHSYGHPQVIEYAQPSAEYNNIHLPEYHTTTSYSYDVYTHGKTNQKPQENFIPSAPAPPVYNAYQGELTSYQLPTSDYSHSVDTSYPQSIATATYTNYPPPQGYSYLDSSHSPSERKSAIVVPDTDNLAVAMNRNEDNVDDKVDAKQETEEQQQTPATEKYQDDDRS